ncbi:hypothetical protein XENOCAPTIV_025469 [Xenoophorus captivus]|uniref:FERM and PDZ domain containing 1 n=1 Tax=Xenoophorus captivus TaxID=1517983 RepID=A0ABV0S3H3_9TELE
MVSLLVGARYGVSQVVNHKLSIMTTLTEFSSITRIELLPESDKVSLVKIYLQDIKSPKVQKRLGELCSPDSSLCFAELSRLADLLPSPPEASEEDDVEEDELRQKGKLQSYISVTLRNADDGGSVGQHPLSTSPPSSSAHKDFVFNFDQSDARCYYNLCSNITPDSAHSLPGPRHPKGTHKNEEKAEEPEPIPILQPPPGFGDSSSDEEFFDARDRFTSPEDPTSGTVPKGIRTEMKMDNLSILSLSDIRVSVMDTDENGGAEIDKQQDKEERGGKETMFLLRKRSRKRRSFMETDYTSTVTYPESDLESESNLNSCKSSNSDNVFEDEDDADTSNSLNYTLCEKQDDRNLNSNSCVGDYSTLGAKDESHIGTQLLLNSEAQYRGHSITTDHILAIKSIRAKLTASTNIISSLNSGTTLKNVVTLKAKSDSTLVSGAAAESLRSPSIMMAKAATLNDLSKELLPPAHFIFQTCSPAIMGRLSASTLRGKIQNLPLYLSRSQESLTQAGVGSFVQSPAGDTSRDDANTTDNFHDITQTLDLETGIAPDSVESDDSDATVTGSELDGEFFVETTSVERSDLEPEKTEVSCQLPVQIEPKQHHQTLYSRPNDNMPGPVTEPPASIISLFQRDTSEFITDTPGPIKDASELNIKVNSLQEDIPGYKVNSQSLIVMTTQNLNGPQLAFNGQPQRVRRTSSDRPLMGLCRPSEQISGSSKASSTGCKVFTICEDLSQTSTPGDLVSTTPLKSEFGCSSVLASGCESVAEGVQVPLEACGCPVSYTNCFSGEDSFDDELTVYEFSCRSQNSGISQTSSGGLHLVTSPPVPSFISTSSTLSPSFPNPIFFSSSTSEFSPLLSPHSDTSESYLSQTHKDTLSHLGQQHYPEPPEGFQVLRRDVHKLLSILEVSSSSDRSVEGLGGRHPKDSCPAHFTENKRVLQLEARRLMSGCQKVTGTGQSPEEMLQFLADSFRTLVELAGVCLWFSGCDRCDRRNIEAVAGLADVARSFRDFCLAAERASSKRSCQDLSTKLLAKQCTALTASVFCLTQLFRTLTAL